jgi:diguanylate cyclase (GGDEF)-like protein
MARILVVDDNAINRKLVVALLQYEGHSTFEATDGVQGLALASAELPQLIITDILMPSMDGYEFVRHLRSDPQLAPTAVIFHTAHYHDREAQKLAQGCQVEHVLAKPCEPAELLRVVALALAKSQATSSLEPTGVFDREHRRLINDKLVQKVEELEKEIEERKRAEEKVHHLNRVYAVLSGINSLIVRVAAREELCREACRLAVDEGRFGIAWIGLKDPAVGRVVPFAWSGASPTLQRFTQASTAGTPGEDDVVAQVLRYQKPVVCNDLETFAGTVLYREELQAQGYRALVVLPLVIAGAAVGCFMLVTEAAGFFDEAEMRLLLELAGDIAFALDHIEKVEKLDYLAYYDSLTGFANRTLFQDRLSHYVDAATRREGELALVIMDLGRFEAINNTLGRHVGDQLLRQAAERFAQCVGNPKDVGRIGWDHLAAVIPDVRSDGSVIRTVEHWSHNWLAAPFLVEGNELTISAKAGIALFPGDGSDASTLMRNAETALRKAQTSPNRHAFYTQHLSETGAEWLALESQLRRALEHEEFVLHYQPKVDLEARRLKGVEALIRWQNPERGLIPPVKFIPLLEETGMIAEVGTWVLRQAILDRSRWLERGLNAPRVAINVSTVQLGREDFVHTFAQSLKHAGSEAGIDIEVTESLIMADVEDNIAKLTQIRKLDVGIAIDDFGTGYSSLGYLAKLPVEMLKIDRSFVIAMLNDPSAMTLVSTIISLAHALKLTVIAEGVESEEQAKILRLLRCDQMQGYLISKPLTFDDMTAYLAGSRNGDH